MPVVVKKNPFKGGLDKTKFSIINGQLMKLVRCDVKRCVKPSGENWSADDCESIVERLIYKGYTIHCISQLTGYSKHYVTNIFNGSEVMSDKFRDKLINMEKKNDGEI